MRKYKISPIQKYIYQQDQERLYDENDTLVRISNDELSLTDGERG